MSHEQFHCYIDALFEVEKGCYDRVLVDIALSNWRLL